MKQKGFIQRAGFTLIEMLVVMVMVAMIATISIADFRKGEKSRAVNIAADGIVGALTSAQNLALSGRDTNNPGANCNTAQYYSIIFDYSNTYRLLALNNCGTIDTIETFTLPPNTRIRAGGIGLNGGIAGLAVSLEIEFLLPYAQGRVSVDGSSVQTRFSVASIVVESTDGSVSKMVTVDGVSGRITQ